MARENEKENENENKKGERDEMAKWDKVMRKGARSNHQLIRAYWTIMEIKKDVQ